jgi:hypothetical protein
MTANEFKKIQYLTNWLFTLTKIGNINFSVLKFKGKTEFTSRGKTFKCGLDPNLEADYQVNVKAEVLTSVILKTIEHGNIKLTVGIPILGGKDVVKEFISSVSVFVNDTIFLTLLLLIIIMYYLSDFIFLCRIVGQSNWKQSLRAKANTKGSKTLIHFVCSILLVNEELESQNKKLKHGFETAFLKYIESDEFQKKINDVVYIELDWKDHTPYVNKFGLAEVVAVKNQINHVGRVLVSRYQGLVLEAKSDMVSFIIESGNLSENKFLALSCVRDFFLVLQYIESRLENKEIQVKYRGAMIVGDFEFEVTDDSYNLNSEAYYIASRLSKISDLPNSHLTLLYKDILGLEQLATLTSPKTETLRGLGSHSFCEVENFISIESVLAESKFHLLRYFRSENAIIALMNFGITKIKESKMEGLDTVFAQMRGFHLDEFLMSNEIPDLYLKLLDLAARHCNDHLTATIVSFSKVLFSANMSNQLVVDYFREMAETKKTRLRANLLESYNELTNYKDQEWNISHLSFENNRLKANVIIGACQDEITDFNKERINEFFNNEDELYIASGLFVMGHLYRLFHTRNKVYFANNEWFKKVPKEIKRYTEHKNPVVRQRAYEELAKILELQ